MLAPTGTWNLLRARALPLRVFLGPLRSELALHRGQEFSGVVELARLHDQPHVAGAADVLERVPADDGEIGELAGLERAELRVDVQRPRAVDRADPDRGRWRDAGEHERLQLAVGAEPGQEFAPARVIGTERDEAAAAGVEERLHFLPLGPVDLLELLVRL